jgi:inner membrane transporter RhtA
VPPQVLVLGGVTSVQFGSAFANKLFDQAGPAGVVFLRLTFGALVLLLLVRPKLGGHSRSNWRAAIGFGVMLAGMNWSFYEALDRLPLGAAVTVEFLGPLAVAVIGSRRLVDLLWVTLAGAGVALLGLAGSHTAAAASRGAGAGHGAGPLSTTGLLFALLAGAFWAGYIVMSKRVGTVFPGLDGLATAMVIGAVLLIPAGVSQAGSALLNPHVLLGGLAVALLSSVIPYSLELTALRRLAASTFGLLMSLEPAVAALAGVLILSQPLYLRTTIALVLVVAASAGSTLTATRPIPQDALCGPK